MDQTPDQRFKVGPERRALLSGTYKRPQPYSTDRRSMDRSGKESLPATRAILASIRCLASPSLPSNSSSADSLPKVDLKTSIKRAAIDWKLANKEAEVFKLKTDIQQLESQLSSRDESEEKLKIHYEKELAKTEIERQSLANKVRILEQEVQSLKSEVSAAKQLDIETRATFLQEKQELEKTVVQLKVHESDMRAQFLDAQEEVKRVKLAQQHEELKLNHEIKCLNLELQSMRTERRLLEANHQNVKQELQKALQVNNESEQLRLENQSLRLALQRHEESDQLRRLFEEDMEELRRLRQENELLKQQLASPSPNASPAPQHPDPASDPVSEDEEEMHSFPETQGQMEESSNDMSGSSEKEDEEGEEVGVEDEVDDEDEAEESDCYLEVGHASDSDGQVDDEDSDVAEISD